MPFLGNIAAFGDQRVGAAGTSSEWAGTIGAGQTWQVGPIRAIGASRLSFSGLYTGAGNLNLDVEIRIGRAWRRLGTIAMVSGTPAYQEWIVSCRQVRLRAAAQGAPATVAHLCIFATGT